MRLFTSIAISFFAYNVFACPVLTGTYMCPTDEGGIEPMVVEQEMKGKVTAYAIATNGDVSVLVADNKVYKSDDGTMAVSVRSVCKKNVLVNVVNMLDRSQGLKIAGNISISVDKENNLRQVFKGKAAMGKRTAPINQVTSCKRVEEGTAPAQPPTEGDVSEPVFPELPESAI